MKTHCDSWHANSAPVPLTLTDATIAYPQAGRTEPAKQLAIAGLDLRCAPGTITLLTGPSGSGKSTVLRAANGLVTHLDHASHGGVARVGTLDAFTAELGDLGAVIGTVFQHPRRQFFTATVVEELAFSLTNAGHKPAAIMNAVAATADLVGITELLPAKLTQLSGGQLQRVASAVALVGAPAVVLLDEPTSNFAAPDIDRLRNLLSGLKSAGATVLLAEHRVYYVRDVVDQVAVMRGGRLERLWSAADFYAQSDAQRRAAGLRQLTPPQDFEAISSAHESAGGPAQPMVAGVSLTDISFSYGNNAVLNIPKLHLPAGQITALMGPCGVGKSTLANVVCGLANPQRGGTVHFDGNQFTARERIVRSALVMQDVHRQLFAASVREELTTGSRLAEGIDPDKLLAALDLTEFADRHPMSLSGGQKQRVVIGAALAADAEVYIFDEPTSGVDYLHLQQIAELLRELADRGKVVLVVTHDGELVQECADQVLLLGPPEKLGGPNMLSTSHLRLQS